MANQSTKLLLSPEEQSRIVSQLSFVQEHRANIPSLARSVAEETGYTVPNVYSVMKGNTFNATIIRAAYNQICRRMGVIHTEVSPSTPGKPMDTKGTNLLMDAQAMRESLRINLVESQNLALQIKRSIKDLQVLDSHIRTHFTFYKEDMSDEVGVLMAEYLALNEEKLPYVNPPVAVDTEEVPQHIIDAIALLKIEGELSEDGFLAKEPVLAGKFSPDGPEVDPMAPGRHVGTDGEEYFISG